MNSLIDRRLNGRNKSAVNRERFLRRYKDQIRKAVQDLIRERSISDMDQGGEINLPARDISEPSFRHGEGAIARSSTPATASSPRAIPSIARKAATTVPARSPARANRWISSPSACRAPSS